MIFDINVNKLIKWLVPHFLNKVKHLAWLQVLLFPVAWLYSEFLIYRDDKLNEATINSQVNRLTEALRHKFLDNTIYIIHITDYINQAFIYLELEGAFLEYDYLASENHVPVDYDFTQAEYDSQYDFIVRIPVALVGQTDVITAFVNKYKFSSKRFIVETF